MARVSVDGGRRSTGPAFGATGPAFGATGPAFGATSPAFGATTTAFGAGGGIAPPNPPALAFAGAAVFVFTTVGLAPAALAALARLGVAAFGVAAGGRCFAAARTFVATAFVFAFGEPARFAPVLRAAFFAGLRFAAMTG